MAEFDKILSAKDEKIATLRQLARHSAATTAVSESTQQAGPRPVHHRKGKAPPVDPFSGDDPSVQFEDWLPGLQRAADWYAWTEAEHLLQLAGIYVAELFRNGTYWMVMIRQPLTQQSHH